MHGPAQIILLAAGGLWILLQGVFSFVSLREGERRAARAAALLAPAGILPILAGLLLPPTARPIAAALVIFPAAALATALLFPRRRRRIEHAGGSGLRFDERDIMFARARLRPGSREYEDYYARRPELKAADDDARGAPGLLSSEAALADRLLFSAPRGSFFLTEALREAADGPVAEERFSLSPTALTAYVKNLALYFGAREAGVARLMPGAVYTHIGRGTGLYGEPVVLDHGWAVAFTVEMAPEMIGSAPNPPAVMESARQYVEAARVAVPLAAALRALGYPARAHIDGNYRVIAPLAARDAGLGEIGRMGLLITPRLGPRVRLGVVTTAAELEAGARREDGSVVDFCRICRKCAEACPARAIPDGGRTEAGGALRWKVDDGLCFRYWTTVGTDCGRCIAVCPYSHADNLLHNAVRFGIRRSALFRRAALAMDDVFYGRKPAPRRPPAWTHPK